MFKKNNDYVSILLNEEILKIAQIKVAGSSLRLTNVITQDVKGVPEEELPKIVQSALSKFKVKSSQIISVVPLSLTTTKNIEIPSVNPEEIKSIVNLQAGRHTPFSREEIQIGYVDLGVYKNNYTKVLLVIVNKNILKRQLAIYEKANLKIKKILFAPEGVAGFYANVLDKEAQSAPVGIIDIDQNSADFIISAKGLAITSRSIPIGKSHLKAEGASGISKLMDELKKTVESYQTEDVEQVPMRYILTSNDALTQEVQTALNDKLKWTTDIVPYLDTIKVTQGVLNRLATEFEDTSFLDVIGSTAQADEAQVDLIPEEVQLQKSIADQGREVFKTAIFGFVLLVLIASTLGLRIYFQNTFLNKLKSDYKKNREEVMGLENLAMSTRIIQNYLESRMVSLETLEELYEIIPDEIYLTGVVMDEDGNVSLQGISEIASLVFNLGTSLKESDLFKSVDIKSTTAKKDRGKDVSAFEITLKLKDAPDDDIESMEMTE